MLSQPQAVVTVPCRYKTAKTLGQGSYAIVKEAIEIETGNYYAAKILNKRLMRGREHLIRNEIEILRKISLGHPNILSMIDCFETANNQLATGGELFDRIYDQGSFFEKDAAQLVYTIVDSVSYLHDHGIVHRDLKPENLLFRTADNNSQLLISDFGLSRIIDTEESDSLSTTCGTPGYMAPEIFNKSGHSKPVDMWAIGVIAYYLLCGYPPFDTSDERCDFTNILHAKYSFTPEQFWRGVSDTAKNFIQCLLLINPAERMTAKQALQHPWLIEIYHQRHPELVNVQATVSEVEEIPATNLLPGIRENFNARNTFRKAVGLIRAINKVKLGVEGAKKNKGPLPEEEDISQIQVIA